MKLKITDNRKLTEIQDEFNKAFPYLKLEFFSKPHHPGAGSAKRLLKDNTLSIGECRNNHHDGSIEVTKEMTVSELEQRFFEIYGLGVQVFRKSGKLWLETTITDNWTLEDQNSQGEALSSLNK